MLYLKVDGKSQYQKEMNDIGGQYEASKKNRIEFDSMAKRQNEITKELEPEGYIDELFASHNVNNLKENLKNKNRNRILKSASFLGRS